MEKRKAILSTLWIFVTLNYIYCDVFGIMDPSILNRLLTGNLGFVTITPEFLLMASILMEIPMAMVLLSRILNYRTNRWANIIAGTLKTLVQISSLLVDKPTSYYMFFSIIEIATTSYIVWYAWTWKSQKDGS